MPLDDGEVGAFDGAADTNASAGTGGGDAEAFDAAGVPAGVIGIGGAEGAEIGAAAGDRLAWPLALPADGAGVGVAGGADAVV